MVWGLLAGNLRGNGIGGEGEAIVGGEWGSNIMRLAGLARGARINREGESKKVNR